MRPESSGRVNFARALFSRFFGAFKKALYIEIYNIIGQKTETLLSKPMPAGYHEVEFNGQNLSSGVYLYRIEVVDPARRTGEWQDVKKMVLLH